MAKTGSVIQIHGIHPGRKRAAPFRDRLGARPVRDDIVRSFGAVQGFCRGETVMFRPGKG